MNKKFLSAILFGALAVASTGSFVSCKDYDDEIDNLQTQINGLASAKDVEAKVGALQSAIATAQAAADKAAAAAKDAAAQAASAEDLAKKLNDLVAKAATKEDLDAVKKIAEAAATQKDLDAAKEEILKVIKEANDELSALKTKVGEIEAKLAKAATEEEVQELAKKVEAASKNFAEISGSASALKSIVFQPEFYVDGIEAAQYTYLKYAALKANTDLYKGGDPLNDKGNAVSLMAKPFSDKYTVTQYYHSGNITEGVTPTCDEIPSVTNHKYVGEMKTVGVKDSLKYALNPSNAVVTPEQCKIMAKNILAMTRGAEAAFKVEKAYAEKGYLTVVYTVDDPMKIITANNKEDQSVVNGKANTTVVELEVNLGDTVINSEWAAIYETSIQPVAIAWNQAGKAKAKTTAEYCGTTGIMPELFKNPYEALAKPYSLGIQYNDEKGFDLKELLELHVVEMDLERKDEAGQNKPVEASAHKTLTLKDAEERYGLTVSFAPVSYITEAGGNKTQPSNYINPELGANGHIVAGTVDAKSAVEDGPFNPTQGVSSVTKQPLVQVLVKKGNDVVLEGYVKMQILRETVNKVTELISLGEKDYNCHGLKYAMTWSQASTIVLQNTMNMSKAEFDASYKLMVNNETTDKCAVLFSEAKDDKKIDVKDTYVVVTEVVDEKGTTNTVLQVALDKYAQQYIIEEKGGKAELFVKYIPKTVDTDNYASEPGVFVRLQIEIKETPVLLTMEKKIAEYWYTTGVEVNGTSTNVKSTELNTIRLNVNKPDDNKNSYNAAKPVFKGEEKEGFVRDVRSAFEVHKGKNDVVLKKGGEPFASTYYEEAQERTMFYFHPAINGTKFIGEDGLEYSLSVDKDYAICYKWIKGDGPSDGDEHVHHTAADVLIHKIEKIGEKPLNEIETIAQKNKLEKGQGIFTNDKLYVTIKKGTATIADKVLVAELNTETGEIYYNHTVEAQKLLNATSYKTAKAKAYVGVYSTNSCGDVLAVKDGVFPAYFLRPLDMTQPKEKEVTDATANGSIAKLSDLSTFTDWRDVEITPAKNGWLLAYYGVNKVTIDLAEITTNMNGYSIDSKKLSDVTKDAKFSLVEVDADGKIVPRADMDDATAIGTSYTRTANKENLLTLDHEGAPDAAVFKEVFDGLALKYENNGLNVYDWSVKVPVTLGYDWGEFKTYVTVKVVKTLGTL